MKKILAICLCLSFCLNSMAADSAEDLLKKVKAKLELVNDYVADGKMKTNVTFIKAPIGKIKLYYKKPNKLKLKQETGISILPKSGISFNSSSLLTFTNYQAIDAGEQIIAGTKTRVIKVLPLDANADVILTTLYIDPTALVIRKAETTTRENGSFEMEMTYGNYASYGLPDKMTFSFNIRNYKMPKGVTLDFDESTKPEDKEKLKNKKGKIEFVYTNYVINKGVDESVFKN